MLADFYPPTIGGTEKNVQTLCKGLTSKGHNVVVCTMHQEGLPTFTEKNKVKVHRFEGFFEKLHFLSKDSTMKFHPPVMDYLINKKIARIIQTEQPDIINTHGWILYSFLPLEEKNIPVFVTLHDFGIVCPVRYSFKHQGGVCDNPLTFDCILCGKGCYGLTKSFLTYFALKFSNKLYRPRFRARALLYTTPNIAERLDLHRTGFVPRPIDTQFYRPIKTCEYDDRILCWVGLSKGKGVDVVFEVAKRLPRYQFDIPFIGDDKEHYMRAKRDNVHFFPPVLLQEGIPNLLNKYPIILGQFQAGAIGGAELEAMACGKPVIAYWNRKYDSFYNIPCPILSSNNVEEIAELIKTHGGNKKLGKASREWVIQHHSTLTVVNRLINIYNYALLGDL